MNTIEQIGLVILIILVVFILIAVFTALVLVLRILKSVKNISAKAEETTSNFADIAMMVGKRVAPVALSTAVAAALRRMRKRK